MMFLKLVAILNLFFTEASDVGSKEVIMDLKDQESAVSLKDLKERQNQKRFPAEKLEKKQFKRVSNNYNFDNLSLNQRRLPEGNLTKALLRSSSQASEDLSKVVITSKFGANYLRINLGDVLECVISQDILAYAGSLSPVRAEVIKGELKGGHFVGNATLDIKTKNVIVEFNSFVSRAKEIHILKASLQSVKGELGLKGSHESYYWSYFFASVMAKAAEGYANAQVSRDRNILGQYVQTPGEANAGKVAVSEGASQTANMLSDQMKQAPEWTKVEGPILAKIFIIESPKIYLRR